MLLVLLVLTGVVDGAEGSSSSEEGAAFVRVLFGGAPTSLLLPSRRSSSASVDRLVELASATFASCMAATPWSLLLEESKGLEIISSWSGESEK